MAEGNSHGRATIFRITRFYVKNFTATCAFTFRYQRTAAQPAPTPAPLALRKSVRVLAFCWLARRGAPALPENAHIFLRKRQRSLAKRPCSLTIRPRFLEKRPRSLKDHPPFFAMRPRPLTMRIGTFTIRPRLVTVRRRFLAKHQRSAKNCPRSATIYIRTLAVPMRFLRMRPRITSPRPALFPPQLVTPTAQLVSPHPQHEPPHRNLQNQSAESQSAKCYSVAPARRLHWVKSNVSPRWCEMRSFAVHGAPSAHSQACEQQFFRLYACVWGFPSRAAVWVRLRFNSSIATAVRKNPR